MSELEEALPPEKPIEVQPSPVVPLLGVMFRQLGLVGGGLVTMMQLIGARDLRGIFDYIRGDEFLSVVTVLIGLACLLWGWFRELRVWKRMSDMANKLDDRVAYVLEHYKLFTLPAWVKRLFSRAT